MLPHLPTGFIVDSNNHNQLTFPLPIHQSRQHLQFQLESMTITAADCRPQGFYETNFLKTAFVKLKLHQTKVETDPASEPTTSPEILRSAKTLLLLINEHDLYPRDNYLYKYSRLAEWAFSVLARTDVTPLGKTDDEVEAKRWLCRLWTSPAAATPAMLPPGAPTWSKDDPYACVSGLIKAAVEADDDKTLTTFFSQMCTRPGPDARYRLTRVWNMPEATDILAEMPFHRFFQLFILHLFDTYRKQDRDGKNGESVWTFIAEKLGWARQILISSQPSDGLSLSEWQKSAMAEYINSAKNVASLESFLKTIDPKQLWAAIEEANRPLTECADLMGLYAKHDGSPETVIAKNKANRMIELMDLYLTAAILISGSGTGRPDGFLTLFNRKPDKDVVKRRLLQQHDGFIGKL